MQPKAKPVCRRLFENEENNNENSQDFEDPTQWIITNNDSQQKWNFDFANETPLEGAWEWEEVSPATD